MNVLDEQDATEYVLSNSFVCRQNRRRTRELVAFSVEFAERVKPGSDEVQWKGWLTSHLRSKIKEEHLGNPILIFILMYVVIPIVVQLFLEWWKNRDKG